MKLTMLFLGYFVKQIQSNLGLEDLYVEVDVACNRAALLDAVLPGKELLGVSTYTSLMRSLWWNT